jgi:hypothetical protein
LNGRNPRRLHHEIGETIGGVEYAARACRRRHGGKLGRVGCKSRHLGGEAIRR